MIGRIIERIAQLLQRLAEAWGRLWDWILNLLGFHIVVEAADSMRVNVE